MYRERMVNGQIEGDAKWMDIYRRRCIERDYYVGVCGSMKEMYRRDGEGDVQREMLNGWIYIEGDAKWMDIYRRRCIERECIQKDIKIMLLYVVSICI